MQYQLECGHVFGMHGWPRTTMRCERCEEDQELVIQRIYRRLIAVECREWKASCGTRCHWARWYGQDKAAAELAAGKHKHFCTIDFLRHPGNVATHRQQYGRAVRPIIASNSNKKMSGMRRYEAVSPTLEMLGKVIQPDIPPF